MDVAGNLAEEADPLTRDAGAGTHVRALGRTVVELLVDVRRRLAACGVAAHRASGWTERLTASFVAG